MEKIKVEQFHIYEDGGYQLVGRWYGRKINFETYPGDTPELAIDDIPQGPENILPVALNIWTWKDLIVFFPVEEWEDKDESYGAYLRFSAIQRLADEIMMSILKIEQPKPYEVKDAKSSG